MMSALKPLKLATLMAAVALAGALLPVLPVDAQEVTILRGSRPAEPTPSIDCSNPDYAQYCQGYGSSQEQYPSTPDYTDAYPYFDGAGVVSGFVHHRGNFRQASRGGELHARSFHGGESHGVGGRR